MTILLVGDKPSRYNKNPNIAFIGARCESRLNEWIEILGNPKVIAVNRVSRDFKPLVNVAKNNNYPIVALGDAASKALGETYHFKLPHPSGRNRKLNKKQYIVDVLNSCKDFLQKSLKV